MGAHMKGNIRKGNFMEKGHLYTQILNLILGVGFKANLQAKVSSNSILKK